MTGEIPNTDPSEPEVEPYTTRQKVINTLAIAGIAGTIITGGYKLMVETHPETIDLGIVAACPDGLEPVADASKNPNLLQVSVFDDRYIKIVCEDTSGNVLGPAAVGIVNPDTQSAQDNSSIETVTVEYNRALLHKLFGTFQPSFDLSARLGGSYPGVLFFNAKNMADVYVEGTSLKTTTREMEEDE